MRHKVRLLPVMLGTLGALIVVSIGATIAINSATSIRVANQLLGQTVVQSVDGLELAVRSHLDAAVHHTDFVIESILAGSPSLQEPQELVSFAAGSLAAAPQIGALLISNIEGEALALRRIAFGATDFQWLHVKDDPELAAFHDFMRQETQPSWGEPAYSEPLSTTILFHRAPILRENEYIGFVVATISTRALSRLANELSEPPNSQVFVLYGEDKVLAHSHLVFQPSTINADRPLPGIEAMLDPVMQSLNEVRAAPEFVSTGEVNLGQVVLDGTRFGVASKPIHGYGETPLTVGAYFDGSTVRDLMVSIFRTILIGVGLLGIGLIVVVIFSRSIANPVRSTAEAAKAVASLEFDRVQPLPSSKLREIDELATSFNAMLVGLKSFGRYVPRNLVRQLIREHRVGAGSEERHLTVMFTDIVGFTPLCEGMEPAKVVDFINDHLTLVTRCIKDEGGTIDKYIGDSVMAFWGAPDDIDNPTGRAMRSAAQLQVAMGEDNAVRRAHGLSPVRIRIGIHSGQLIVGDIGSPDRINYTVIGDVVNTAQRLEALGKEVSPGGEVTVLVSGAAKQGLEGEFAFADVGQMSLKGRKGEIEVFKLLAKDAAAER